MSKSIEVTGIDSVGEVRRVRLSDLPFGEIEKLLFIVKNEPDVTTLQNKEGSELAMFIAGIAHVELIFDQVYGCYKLAESNPAYASIMVYMTEAHEERYSLVVDLDQNAVDCDFPFKGRFVAGPFASYEDAAMFGARLLVREGYAVAVDVELGQKRLFKFTSKIEGEGGADAEQYNVVELIDEFQSCLGGLEWFHVFSSLQSMTSPKASVDLIAADAPVA